MRNWLYRFGLAIILFESLSGAYLLVTRHLGPAGMGALLFHLVFGLFLWISCVALTARHLHYRKTIRGGVFDALGFGTAGVLFVSALTGTYLILAGVSGHFYGWCLHLLASGLAATGMAAYVGYILAFLLRKAKAPARRSFSKGFSRTAIKIGAVALLAAVVAVGAGLSFPKPTWSIAPAAYSFLSGNLKPFYPSHIHTEHDTFVHADRLTQSRSCGTTGCHVDIVKQWEQSAHRLTPNPFVEAAMRGLLQEADAGKLFGGTRDKHIELLRAAKPGMQTLRHCAGCHAPAALLSGKIEGKHPLEGLREYEGNSCLVCHSITRLDRTARGPARRELGFMISEPTPYPFSEATGGLGKYLNQTLIRAKPQTHRESFMKPFFRQSHYCASCHDQLLFRSWEYSKYGPQSNPWHREQNQECQSCHMPQVKAESDVSARVKGTVADHRFVSAGLSLAKLYNNEDQFTATQEFLQDKKLTIKILTPDQASLKEPLELVVRIANVGVGHIFPSGPEGDLIESWPEIRLRDERGKVVFTYGALDPSGNLDEGKTQIYRVTPLDRNRKALEMDKHRSWKFAAYRLNVIPPGMYDEVPLQLRLPESVSSRRLTIEARLRYRKPSQRYADFVFGRGKFIVPVADIAKDSASIELTQDPKLLSESKRRFSEQGRRAPAGLQKRSEQDNRQPPELDLETSIIYDYAESLHRQGDPAAAHEVLSSLSRFSPGPELKKFIDEFPSTDELTGEDLQSAPLVKAGVGGPCFVNVGAEDPTVAMAFLHEISGIWDPVAHPAGEYENAAFLFSIRKNYVATLYEPGPSNKDPNPFEKVCVSKPLGPERDRLAGFRLVETLGRGIAIAFAAKFEGSSENKGRRLLLTDRYYDWWAQANTLNALPTVVSRRMIRAYLKRD